MRWRPSDLNLFLLKFLQNLKQKKKSCRLLSGNFAWRARFAQVCSKELLKWFSCDYLISIFFPIPLINTSQVF
jgi:hypothetical protein